MCFQGDERHDTWIFCLAVLLSSTLVYNSMGTIDNNALEKLQYPHTHTHTRTTTAKYFFAVNAVTAVSEVGH